MARRTNLQFNKCFNHMDRESVAICLECKEHFCRECIIDHEGRMLCASCIDKVTVKDEKKKDNVFLKAFSYTLFSFVLLSIIFFIFYSFLFSITSRNISDFPSQIFQNHTK